MAKNINDIIQKLPASARKKVDTRGMQLIAEEMSLLAAPYICDDTLLAPEGVKQADNVTVTVKG